MGKSYNFQYIVIGSGPAGGTAALELAKAGKKVCLIENRFFGGSNLNTRDVPYLISLDFSHAYSKVRHFPELQHQDFAFNLPSLPTRALKTVLELAQENQNLFRSAGITCVKGFANFLDDHTVAVGDQRLTAETFILATGSKLKTGGIGNIDLVKHLTPETALKIARLPKVAAIVGGGPTGVEIAQYYAELGIKVVIFEAGGYLLPREDRETSDTLSSYFQRRLGITVLPSCKVVALEEDEFSKRVVFRYQNTEKMVRVDCVVLATGSAPVLDYGLENAKVAFTNTGITVDKLFQTSAKNIYAIGDCIGKESSTDRAMNEGMSLAVNLVNKTKNPLDYRGIARVIKTYPEIATVGYTENDLLQRDRKYQRAIIKLSDIPAGKIYNFNYGFLKLLTDRTGHLLGATIVAPNAEALIGELSLALRHNLSVLELASTPHLNNGYSYLIKIAARELFSHQKSAKKSKPQIIKLSRNPKLNSKKLHLKSPKLPNSSQSAQSPKPPKPSKLAKLSKLSKSPKSNHSK